MKMSKNSIQNAISVFLLMLFIMLTLVQTHYSSRNRNLEHVEQYIDELSLTTAKHVANVFADKMASIESVAYLYGNAIESTDVDCELLEVLEEKSGFDWIRFVASDGTDYTSDGSITNVKDRDYFIKGMSGETGICEVLVSRVNGEKLVGFYAPVYFDDEICGIMVGFLTESTVSDILETNLYGYPADTYICRQDGTVLGRYMGEGTFEINNTNEAISYVAEDYREDAVNAIEKQEAFRFIFNGSVDQSVGYIVPIKGTCWSLIQLFPSEATNILMRTTQKDSIKLFVLTTVIFTVFIIYLIFTYIKNQKAKSEELAFNKINSLLRSVAEDYVCLIDVDLETQQEVRYSMFSGDMLKWSDGNNDYTHCIEDFANTYVAEYDRKRFVEATKLPVLRDTLDRQNDFYIEYDAVVGGKTLQFEGKFTISDEEQFKNHMLISIRDITESTKERKEKERELSEARIMAESANKAKTRFLFNMSHDIRTPMNAIIGFTNLLEKNIDDKDKMQAYIQKIKYSSDFLLSLINNILEMARIESGKMTLDETLWNVEQFNDTLISVFEEQFRQKNLKFTREINIIHTDVICDALKLKQIYLNILGNAIKYTPEGGSINMTLEELPSDREGYAQYRCTVTDTGIGMSEEFLGHIFEEFSREISVSESKITGSGLGMPIVKRLVEFMDGTIEVESKPGKGTSFTVTIPHRIADKNIIDEMRSNAVDYTDIKYSDKRILLAEDNDMNAEIAEEILGSVGFQIERAKDGVICVHMVQEAKEDYYDLILMDIQMPNMNGYEAAQSIRRLSGKKGEIPIVAMTANAFEEDKQNALDSGMNGHISKPIEIPRLMETISKFF